jgi:hypothetical protein
MQMFWTFKFSFEILTFIGSVAVLATIPPKLGDFFNKTNVLDTYACKQPS